MTGRIEATLNEIHKSIGEHVDRWMRIHYIETLTHLPKAVFAKELRHQVTQVMTNSLSDQVGQNIQDFLNGKIDCNLKVLGYEQFGLAKRVTAAAVKKLMDQIVDTKVNAIFEEVSETLISYGVKVTHAELCDLAREFSIELAPGHPKIREVLVARYVAGKDVNTINQLMSSFQVAECPIEYTRLIRKTVNAVCAELDKCDEYLTNDLGNFLVSNPHLIVPVGMLLIKGSMVEGSLPALPQLVRNVSTMTQDLDLITSDGQMRTDELWHRYQSKYVVKEQTNMQQIFQHPYAQLGIKYDQPTVIRIGNQISGLLKDSALDSDPMKVNYIIQRVMALGVTTARGVELVTQAVAGNFNPIEVQCKLIQAVMWEMEKENLIQIPQSAQFLAHVSRIQTHMQKIAANDFTEVAVRKAYTQVTGQPEIDLIENGVELNHPIEGKAVPPKLQMLELEENFYRSIRCDDEIVVAREYGVHPVSGMPMQGTWVLRNFHTGEFLDSDKYLNDLTERNNLKIRDHA